MDSWLANKGGWKPLITMKGLIPVVELTRVVGILHPQQVGGPGDREMGSHTMQGKFQILIGPFHLAILRVVTRGEAECASQGLTECLIV